MSDSMLEANQNIELALTRPDGYQHLSVADLIQLAQVNATLELAEQQRIANAITLIGFGEELGIEDAHEKDVELYALVRESLGLS